jgi:hypothetical protein
MRGRNEHLRETSSLKAVRRLAGLVIVSLGVALVAASCGSSSPSRKQVAANDFLKFSECMRANGVPNFPDPSSGGGINLNPGSGLNLFSPSFKAAQAHCRKLLPGGGPPTHASASREREALQVAECMRRHGVTGFPDPTLTPPSSPAGYSIIDDQGGVVTAIPDSIDVQSPAFKQAASACGFH